MSGVKMVRGYKMAPQDSALDYSGYGRDFVDARGLLDPIPALNGYSDRACGGCMADAPAPSVKPLLGLVLVGAFLWWMAD